MRQDKLDFATLEIFLVKGLEQGRVLMMHKVTMKTTLADVGEWIRTKLDLGDDSKAEIFAHDRRKGLTWLNEDNDVIVREQLDIGQPLCCSVQEFKDRLVAISMISDDIYEFCGDLDGIGDEESFLSRQVYLRTDMPPQDQVVQVVSRPPHAGPQRYLNMLPTELKAIILKSPDVTLITMRCNKPDAANYLPPFKPMPVKKHCPICVSPLTKEVVKNLRCNHEYHKECSIKWMDSREMRGNVLVCPQCRAPMTDFRPIKPNFNDAPKREVFLPLSLDYKK